MKKLFFALTCLPLLAMLAFPVSAQDASEDPALRVASLRAIPPTLTVEAGQVVSVEITPVDSNGRTVDDVILRVRGARRGMAVVDNSSIRGLEAGSYILRASVVLPSNADRENIQLEIPVTVTWPGVAEVVIEDPESTLYAGTMLRMEATALNRGGTLRTDAVPTWGSSDASVATVDRFGYVQALAVGATTLTANVEGVEGRMRIEVLPFNATTLEITGGSSDARTGDVITFEAVVNDPQGTAVTDVPILWSYTFVPDDSIQAPGAAGIVNDGKFVGQVPGQYTVLASAGGLTGVRVLDIRPRNAVRQIEITGQGSVHDSHSSDLWIFEGVDGRDYAMTGTWGADGWAFFWDVTDPTSPVKTDSIQVDARTVNDVKVSPDARYAAISREGASNRRNGVVILDMADPAHPTIASVYDDGLTGGVHNMFATNDHLFALSNGDKYVILDVTDIRNPTYVSEYNHPESRVHDVWVHDGLAYSSEWGNGVVVVDVGNGKWGGSIENPVYVTNIPLPVASTHASFPYFQEETGKFYLFLGDEIMARGEAAWSGAGLSRIPERDGPPSVTSGYVHIIDFTDPENPRDVARYEVAEFGSHNLWVEDDVLYQAYYEGGVRVVDVSGELMGNLATQGREIAVHKAFDPSGYVRNAPMAWGAQPYKGHVFFSDFNSGLWAIKVMPRSRPVS